MSDDVLIAFDGSDPARVALLATVALLPGFRFVVLVVHADPVRLGDAAAARMVLSDTVVREAVAAHEREIVTRGQALADAGVVLAQGAGADASPATAATSGASWRAIQEEARQRDAALVACGTRGLGGFGRAVLGSTSSGLVHHADRPVLVVPEDGPPAGGLLLIAYDDSDPARAAIRAAARYFPGRETIVAYAWRSPTQSTLAGHALLAGPDPIREITRELDERDERIASAVAADGAALAGGLGLDARPLLVETAASTWSALAQAAQQAEASVVIAGCRGQGAAAGALLGSVSSGLVRNADRPTLIAR